MEERKAVGECRKVMTPNTQESDGEKETEKKDKDVEQQ